MFARLVFAEISVYPGTREKVDKVLVNLRSALNRVNGLDSYTLFHNWDKGEVGIFALWESEEAERNAWERIKKNMDDARDILWRGRPLFKTFDVYEHGPTSTTRATAPTPRKTTKRTATVARKTTTAKKPGRPRGRPPGSTTRRTATKGTTARRTTTRRGAASS